MQDAERQCAAAAGAPDPEVEQLREELAKWRARVPRLASALRQRTEELEALRRRASPSPEAGSAHLAGGGSKGESSAADAGIRQRDALIAELEGKVQALDRNWRSVQGELHAARLELDDLRGQIRSWKQKWQLATQSLDDHGRLLAEACEERDHLAERNAQLLETTELANSQIRSLGESVESLRMQVRQGSDREAELSRRLDEAAAENAGLSSRLQALGGQADEMAGFAQMLCASAVASAQDLQAANRRTDDLRRSKDAELQSLRRRAEQAEESLRCAERAVDENSRYVAQLDDRLERQKILLAELEEELAEAQTARVGAGRQQETLAARNAEIAALQQKVRALEQTVREQTAEPDRAGTQREVGAAAAPGPADDRMLLALNEQLDSARVENASLAARVEELEGELTHIRMRSEGDDLTQIRGVGPKLAGQLNAMGIFRLEQIAELDAESLADEAHRLYAHKGRILRDGWIEQAARLVSH